MKAILKQKAANYCYLNGDSKAHRLFSTKGLLKPKATSEM